MTEALQNIANSVNADLGIVEATINGKKVSIIKLPAFPMFELGTELAEIFMLPLGSIGDGLTSFNEILPEDRSVFSEIASGLVGGMRGLNKRAFLDTLLKGSTCQGKELNLDTDRISITELLFIIELALKENFSDFFTEYLKGKGLEIPSLIEVMKTQVTTLQESYQVSEEIVPLPEQNGGSIT